MSVFAEEAWSVISFALPQMAILYVSVIVTSGTLAFVGNYDPVSDHMAGAVLGNMYYQVTGLSIGCGLSIQLGAFCAQNFGRSAPEENSIFFWKCVKTLTGAFGFATVAAVGAESALAALGQPTSVIPFASWYNYVQLLSLPANWGTSVLNATLASQQDLFPGVAATVIGNVINFGLAWYLLAVAKIGFLGVAWGNVTGQWVSCLCLAMYVIVQGRQSTVWAIPTSDSATKQRVTVGFYVREALPSAFSLWAEWWAACILGVLAGLLPDAKTNVAANGILFSCLSVFYMTFVGVQQATQQRIGELVGQRNSDRIPRSIASAATVALTLAVAVSIILFMYGERILHVFSNDQNIVSEAVRANPGMVLSIAPYAVMMCLLGAMRPAGLQRWGTGALIVAFYVCGIPFAAVAGLEFDGGLLGIWSGNVVSLTLAALLMTGKVCTVEWSSVVAKAMEYQSLDEPGSPGSLLSEQADLSPAFLLASWERSPGGRMQCL